MDTNFEFTGNQLLGIWWLLLSGGECWNTDLKPTLEAARRKSLVDAGLIQVEKRRKVEGKGPAVLHLTLLDQGWRWAAENLEGNIPRRDSAALAILRQVMARLNARIANGDFSFADFCRPRPALEPERGSKREMNHDLKARIIAECERLSDGVYESRVRLADIRDSMADVPREQVDQTLWELADSQRIKMFRLDRFHEITPRDAAAALETGSHDKRHILYLSRPE